MQEHKFCCGVYVRTHHRPIGPYHTEDYPVLYVLAGHQAVESRADIDPMKCPLSSCLTLAEQILHSHSSFVLNNKEFAKLALLELHSSVVYKVLKVDEFTATEAKLSDAETVVVAMLMGHTMHQRRRHATGLLYAHLLCSSGAARRDETAEVARTTAAWKVSANFSPVNGGSPSFSSGRRSRGDRPTRHQWRNIYNLGASMSLGAPLNTSFDVNTSLILRPYWEGDVASEAPHCARWAKDVSTVAYAGALFQNSAGMHGAGKGGGVRDLRENPPTSGIVRHDSHMRKSVVTRPGIEPGSPLWEASRLTTQEPWPLRPGTSRARSSTHAPTRAARVAYAGAHVDSSVCERRLGCRNSGQPEVTEPTPSYISRRRRPISPPRWRVYRSHCSTSTNANPLRSMHVHTRRTTPGSAHVGIVPDDVTAPCIPCIIASLNPRRLSRPRPDLSTHSTPLLSIGRARSRLDIGSTCGPVILISVFYGSRNSFRRMLGGGSLQRFIDYSFPDLAPLNTFHVSNDLAVDEKQIKKPLFSDSHFKERYYKAVVHPSVRRYYPEVGRRSLDRRTAGRLTDETDG
ncbi:hypothetical protein PR048_000955 [Dryococelus australis]|uniref:Uncharacterized protein n=1 Tax=Dryococelus australis TaxID=614101 RepID=A0ABQ9IG52_9NEOP|nr:hypothetical protein PR048_000955 [Dryococelus australis]